MSRIEVDNDLLASARKSRACFYLAESNYPTVGSLHASIRSCSFSTPPAPLRLKHISTLHSQSIYHLSSHLLYTKVPSKRSEAYPLPLQMGLNGKVKAKVELHPGPVKPASKSSTNSTSSQGGTDSTVHADGPSTTSTTPYPTKSSRRLRLHTTKF